MINRIKYGGVTNHVIYLKLDKESPFKTQHPSHWSLARVECQQRDVEHGNDEDVTVEGSVAVDFVPVLDLQPRHVQQRHDQLHHDVVVGPEDNAGQAGEGEDQESGDERERLGERGGELTHPSRQGEEDGNRAQGDSHRSQDILQQGRSPTNTRHTGY